MYPGKFYFEESGFKLIENDTFATLKELDEKSFDMIFADPPYYQMMELHVVQGKWLV